MQAMRRSAPLSVMGGWPLWSSGAERLTERRRCAFMLVPCTHTLWIGGSTKSAGISGGGLVLALHASACAHFVAARAGQPLVAGDDACEAAGAQVQTGGGVPGATYGGYGGGGGGGQFNRDNRGPGGQGGRPPRP